MKMHRGQIDTENIIKIIQHYEYVSFDIFDTLIKRECFSPSRLFNYLEMYCGIRDFAKRRIAAEEMARKKTKEQEITLNDIYFQLSQNYPNEKWDQVKADELFFEDKFCVLNPAIIPVLEHCYKYNKKVIVISDMYLDEEFISSLLKKNNIAFEYLFVSSKCKLTKQTGDLYKFALKQLGVSSRRIIHIGDNKKSDYWMARKNRIKSILIPTNVINTMFANKYRWDGDLEYLDLSQVISNNYPNTQRNYYFQCGIEVLGPILFGFSKWLIRQIEKEKIDKVFFLSRDGQLMQRAFKICEDQKVQTEYMYASRRSLIVPTLWIHSKVKDIQRYMFWPRVGNIVQFCNKIGIGPEKVKQYFKIYGFDINEYIEYDALFENSKFLELYDKYLEPLVIRNSKKEYDLLLLYLRQIKFKGKIAVVDIGWNGNMQRALEEVAELAEINVDIYGYYVGVNPNSENIQEKLINAKGYIFDYNKNIYIYQYMKTFISLFELMFSADHGSVLYFNKSSQLNKEIEPVLEEWEYTKEYQEEYRKIKCFQEGALNFVELISKSKLNICSFSPKSVSKNLILLGCEPSYESAIKWGDFVILDDEVQCLAKMNKRMKYVFNPRLFIKDLIFSPWRVGFLKRNLVFDLPYFSLLSIIKKISKG